MIRAEETIPSFVYPSHPVPQPSARQRDRQRTSFWRIGQILVVIILTGVILPGLLLCGVGLIYETRQLILPGINVLGTDLSGSTQEQAADKLNAIWNYNHPITLTGAERSWQLSPIELGLFLDPAATAHAAYSIQRSGVWTQLEQIVRGDPQPVLPVVVYRADLARTALEKLAAQLDQPAQEATLRFEQGKWSAVPGKNGLALDIDATLAGIAADPLGTFFYGQVPLAITPLPPVGPDTSAVAARLQALVNKSLKIQAYDPIKDQSLDWSVAPETLAGWISVSDPSAQDPKINLNATSLQAYLDNKKASLAPTRSLAAYQLPANLASLWQDGRTLNLTIQYLPTTYQVVAGDTLWKISAKVEVSYWMILQSNPGISDASLRIGQTLQIPSRSDLLPLPVVLGKRIVINITKQHMWTYENGKLRKEYVISTGMSDSPTMPGVYQVQSHVINAYASNWDLWMPNFLAIYQAVPGFWNGIHGLPIMSNGVRLWANVLGKPVTYGCILMNLKDGEDVYNWAQEGVVVEIDP
jgi:LysM repeat protein